MNGRNCRDENLRSILFKGSIASADENAGFVLCVSHRCMRVCECRMDDVQFSVVSPGSPGHVHAIYSR